MIPGTLGLPLLLGLLLLLFPRHLKRWAKLGARAMGLLCFVLAYVEGGLDSSYFLLTIAVGVTALWLPLPSSVDREGPDKAFYFGGLLIAFSGFCLALAGFSLLFFFLGWEIAIVASYFLLREFGGSRRYDVAPVFFVMAQVSLLPFLVVVVACWSQAPGLFFQQEALSLFHLTTLHFIFVQFPLFFQEWMLALLLGSLVLLLPLYPLSFWWIDSVAEAPPALGLFLVASLTKGASVIFLVFLGLFMGNEVELKGWLISWLLVLAGVTAWISSLALGRQSDLRRAVAFLALYGSSFVWVGWTLVLQLNELAVEQQLPLELTSLPFFPPSVFEVMLHVPCLVLLVLLSHLEVRCGSRFVEDFGHLGSHHRCLWLQRGWTLMTLGAMGMPFLGLFPVMAWLMIVGWQTSFPYFLGLALPLVWMGLSLVRLRHRLFFGDAYSNGQAFPRELRGTLWLLTLFWLLVLILPGFFLLLEAGK